jgi:hypothetical protein
MKRTGQVAAGQSRTERDRAGQSRTGLDKQDRTVRAGQDDEQDRTGRAQVSRSDDLDLDLVESLELETNQSGSGFIQTKFSKNIEMKLIEHVFYSKRCGESVQITWSIVR